MSHEGNDELYEAVINSTFEEIELTYKLNDEMVYSGLFNHIEEIEALVPALERLRTEWTERQVEKRGEYDV